ncbi:hypothetical protein RKE25_02640 [Dyella sp. BiH032]|uniref:hypothetical protein n=1 Tax=Dyella sp. BiH032 TaxID=3075430 RepID=UPI002892AFEE|nr:hypothetical protein [Dyella sp. BiH032]WNL46553.1 hypothetical protein RKE25_02640 [Dyella sp. BiH032]
MPAILRQLLLGLALVGALVAYYLITTHRIHAAEQAASVAQAKVSALDGELAAAKRTEKIVTVYVDRVQVVRERGATIVQRIPVYVTPQADAACTLPRGFVRVHDAAAESAEVPGAPGPTDAQPSGIALSAAAGVIVGNYTTCHATAEQLTALQAWVRDNSGTAP